MMSERFIAADNRKINFMGRIDFSNAEKPMLIYAGSNLSFRFSGSHLSIVISSFSFYCDLYIGYIIDGTEGKIILKKENLEDINDIDYSVKENLYRFNKQIKSARFEIPVDQNISEHSFTLFKRLDNSHLFTFEGAYTDGEILEQPPLPSKKIEFYGDSVCCGSVCEAVEFTGMPDPPDGYLEYGNAWHSFAMKTGRKLNAQVNNVSQGGLALLDGTGYCFAPYYPGLQTIYSKLQYMTHYPQSNWDFSSYIPHVVVIAIGQNDPHKEGPSDNDICDPEFRNRWKSSYMELLNDLMVKYPETSFILTMTILCHNPEWDRAIDEIVSEMNSERIYRNYFKRNGCATPGHPRISEQEEMAEELSDFISSLGPEIWNF